MSSASARANSVLLLYQFYTIYMCIYIINTILLLYYFYTTSILHLSVKYYLYYSLQFFTYDWPRSSCSDQPDAHAWPGGFFSPSQAWKENPWDFIEITKKKFRIAVLLQQSPAWLRDLKCDMIMMTQTIHRLSSSAINRMGILQLTKPAKPASHMQSRARGKASKQRKIPTKHPSTAASSSSNLSRKNTKSSQLETTVSWRVSH